MKNILLSLCLIFPCVSLVAQSQNIDSLVNAQRELISHADSLITNYKFERALAVLEKCDTSRIDILLRIGQCQFRLGASEAAIRPYERVLQVDSSNTSALNYLGQLYSRNNDFVKALSTFTQLIKIDSTNSYYCKQAGTMAARLENMMLAQHWFRKALNLNPADTEASVALGNILMDLEEYEGVDSIVSQALSLDPNFKPMLLLQAKSAFEQQHSEAVVITVHKLLTLTKSDTTVLYARMLGVSFFHLQEYDKLELCMTYLVRNRIDQEWVYYYMGIAMRELGDVSGSIAWFERAAQKSISENTKTYYYELGQSYEALNDRPAAIRAYRAAYNYSKEGILLYHLARNFDAYYKDKGMAVEYYKKYLESDDTIRRAKEYARKRMRDMGYF